MRNMQYTQTQYVQVPQVWHSSSQGTEGDILSEFLSFIHIKR